MSEPNPVTAAILRWHASRPEETSLLVAVSGGPDSLALLDAVHSLLPDLNLAGFAVAHFDHGLRETASAEDASFVSDFCAARGIACHIGNADPARLTGARKGSLQEAARDARYAFLESVADEVGADIIATAHTRDDQIETVMINILRGTGIDGLAGIPPRRGRFVRPLLGVSRADIEAYCKSRELNPRHDRSNDDPDHYLRNRVRLELLPLLERDYHPGSRDALLRLSRNAAVEADYLDDLASAALGDLSVPPPPYDGPPGEIALDSSRLALLHEALQRRVIRAAVHAVRGTRAGLTEAHVETVLGWLTSARTEPRSITIGEPSLTIAVRGDAIVLSRPFENVILEAYCLPIAICEGSHALPGGWSLTIGTMKLDTAGPHAFSAVLDRDYIDGESLAVRSWEPGDRIAPLGMKGQTKKLQDLFVNAKIPKERRGAWPIVVDRNGVLWTPGLTLDDRAKVTDETANLLYFSVTSPFASGARRSP